MFYFYFILSLQSSVVVRSDANRVAGSSSRFKEGVVENERVVASATVRDDGGKAETDEEIKAAIRNNAISIWHPSCTARMSAYNATDGVVNPDLTVKGVSGLRIVDASVFVSS